MTFIFLLQRLPNFSFVWKLSSVIMGLYMNVFSYHSYDILNPHQASEGVPNSLARGIQLYVSDGDRRRG